ncbi:hypothetical protein HDU76_006873 [Blyttiomyces sp. JEL0837]|nr:hypothetical protein HDU76_006873 [Blyttiomyces sp. JEL0837]
MPQLKGLIFLLFLILTTTFAAPLSPISRRDSYSTSSIDTKTVQTVADLAKFSGVTFCQPQSWVDWNCALCQDDAIKDTRDAVPIVSSALFGFQGFTAVNENFKTIIVAFRGSTSIQNWIADLVFAKVDTRYSDNLDSRIQVHSGFLETWNSVKNVTRDAVKSLVLKNPGYSVTFAGHSLGGAVAVLAALDLADCGIVDLAKTNIATTGQPRIGNKAFSAYFNSQPFASVTRTVNQNDIVPHYPFEFMGFQQTIGELWINPNMNNTLVNCNDIFNDGEDTNCANTQPPFLSFTAHGKYFTTAMVSYRLR